MVNAEGTRWTYARVAKPDARPIDGYGLLLPSPARMVSAFLFFPAVGILVGCVQGYGEWKRRRRSGPQFADVTRAFGLGALAGAACGIVAAVVVTALMG